jgi:hypothetical protein
MSRELFGPVADLRDELRARTKLGRVDCVRDPETKPSDYLKVAVGTGPPRVVVWDETGYRWQTGEHLGTTAPEAAEALARTLGVPIT